MDKVTTIAVDIGKRALSASWVDPQTGEIGPTPMTRVKFEEFTRAREPSRVMPQAGGGGGIYQQDGAFRLGARDARTGVPARPRRASSVADQHSRH